MAFCISPQAEQALALLQKAGYEAWVVGGCVRDQLMGLVPKDYDITTSARPEETQQVFRAFPVVETGLAHGTVTVMIEGEPLEITTYRVDGSYSDARHPDKVTFTASLQEDAARRDFTMNAMAYSPTHGLRDYFDGQADIDAKRIRCVGEPDKRFQEDALRILRALRFASVLGFQLEEKTEAAARRNAPLLTQVSAERLFTELGQLLCGAGAGTILTTYPDILGQVIPEVLPMVKYDQRNIHHCYDLLTHTAVAVDHVPQVLPLRLAMLLHDIGKPLCFTLGEDGQGHFRGHARKSVELTHTILTRLHAPNQLREQVETLVKYHDVWIEPEPKPAARWLRRLGPEQLLSLLLVQRGDTAALAPWCSERRLLLDALEEVVEALLAKAPCFQTRDLAVDGHDLMAQGYEGKEIGQRLDALLEAVLAGQVPNERQALLDFPR